MDKYEPIQCNRCQKPVIPVVVEKYHSHGMNLTASCPDCGKYIKHLPQSEKLEALPFGKYKGEAFAKVAEIDRNYLIWLSDQDLSPRVADAVETALLIK